MAPLFYCINSVYLGWCLGTDDWQPSRNTGNKGYCEYVAIKSKVSPAHIGGNYERFCI